MTPKTVEYYDWFEDLQPIILANLNEILVSKGITPLHDLHGGQFYEGKWERVNGHSDYRNYWHAYIDLWGERVRNDSYDEIYFPWCDNEEEWKYWYERAEKFGDVKRSGYVHTDPKWACDLVHAIRKMCRDHNLYESVLIKWCW
jgi:hypothetical protein